MLVSSVGTASDSPLLGEPFDRSDMVEKVAGILRKAIFEQRLRPGDRIRELVLAHELRVSRTPIREALRWLEREGLVKRVPFRGIRVAYLTAEEIAQTFRIRAVLEAMAVVEARPNLREEDRQTFRRYLRAMDDAAKRKDLSEFNSTDMAFHRFLWQLSNNAVLNDILNQLCNKAFIVFNAQTLAHMSPDELAALTETHREFLQIIEDDEDRVLERVTAIQNRWLSDIHGKLFPEQQTSHPIEEAALC